MKKGLSVFALAALLFGVGAVADSNHEVQAKSHSKGGSVKRAKATPVRRAVARPVARRVVAKPVARRAVARPVARRAVARPVARRVVAKPVARKTTTRPVVRKTTPTVKTAVASKATTAKKGTKTAVGNKAKAAKKGTKTAVVNKATVAKKGTKTAVANKATATKKGTKTAVTNKATTAKKGTKTAAANKATTAKKGTKTAVGNKATAAKEVTKTAAASKATEAKKGKFKLPLHGNYCGPGHGDLTKNPKPVDTLDAICRKHDIGYKKDGYFSRKANAEFVKDVVKNFNKMKPAEKVKAAIFSAGFLAINNTPLREVSTIIGRITGK